MDVLVGAGGKIQEGNSLAEISPVGSLKVNIPVNGKRMIDWIMGAIGSCPEIGTVYVIGYEGSALHCPGKRMVLLEDTGKMLSNIGSATRKILEENPSCEKFLWISGDLPFITSEMLSWFIRKVSEDNGDLFCQIIPQHVMERRFPEAKRTYLKLGKNRYCMGDVNCLVPQVVLRCCNHPVLAKMEENRKNFLRIASFYGFYNILKVLFGLGRKEDIIQGIKDKFDVNLKLIDSLYAEMGYDIDRIDHLNFCNHLPLRN